MTVRRTILALAMLGAVGPGSVPATEGPDPSRHEFVQTHMGSAFRLVLYSEDGTLARRASDAAFARIAELDARLSDYNPESELMRLCAQAGGPPVRVSSDLFDVLKRSVELARRSNGSFDPTVAPVVRLWRRARRDRKMPEADTLAAALRRVDYTKVVLDESAHTVRLTDPDVKLDLGGIAKGYASQAAIAVLAEHGIRRALVAGAGDIVVGDPPPGEAGWKVGIDPLRANESGSPDGPSGPTLLLRNAAISTSGDAEQFVEIGGKRYAHIVDPRTGLGVVDRSGVTVVAPDGATADSLATAVFVLSPEQGLALIEATEGCSGLVVRSTAQGPRIWTTPAFERIPRFEVEAVPR